MTHTEHLIDDALAGDAKALEALVRRVEDHIYRLSMRMLVNPEDARDACQEILIRVVTKLSTFKRQSRFETWAYRIAVNYLLTARKLRDRDPKLSFESFGTDLLDGLADEAPAVEDQIALNELRVSCTMAMLLCLDPVHRVAYVLGDILDLEHREAAEAMEVSPATFRKRLSRARARVEGFTRSHCGLAGADACSCARRLPAARALGRVPPGAANGAPAYDVVVARAKQVEAELVTLTLQRAMPPLHGPGLSAEIARITAPG